MAKRAAAKVVKGTRNDARKNGKASKSGIKHEKTSLSTLQLVLLGKGPAHKKTPVKSVGKVRKK